MKIKIGLVGLGEAVQALHMPALEQLRDRYEVTAVADASRETTDYIAETFHIPHRFYDADELLCSDTVDAVILCSPDAYHAQQVQTALQNGKHVFLEKPAALCLEDLEDMIDVAEKHRDLTAMVGYVRRYADPFRKLKQLLAEDPRPVEYLRCRTLVCEAPFYLKQTRGIFRWKDISPEMISEGKQLRTEQMKKALGENPSDALQNTYTYVNCSGVHILSAVRDLVGSPKRVARSFATNEGKRIAALLEYDNFMGVFEYVNDQSVAAFDEAIEIFQGNRKFLLKFESPYIRNLPVTLEMTETIGLENKKTIFGPWYTDNFRNELIEFVNCITNKTSPMTPLADARADLLLAQEIAQKSID